MESYIANKEESIKLKELKLKERDLIMKEKAYDIIEAKAKKYIRNNSINNNYVDASLAIQEALLIITVIGVLIFTLAPLIYK